MSLFPDVINSQESMDDSVLNFTNTLNDVIEPFCNHVEKVNRNSSYSPNARSTCYDNNVYDKPWFNEDVKICYSNYKKALRDFHNCKSFSKHRDLLLRKKIYKAKERKCKRDYLKSEGDMLSKLKRSNPKQFYSKFSKRRKGCSLNISLDDFRKHFESVTSGEGNSTDTAGNAINFDESAVFEELDGPISKDEIIANIKNLKKGKAHGSDLILNEMLIECKSLLIPILHKLFNNILNTGFFPTSWSSAVIIPIFKKGDKDNVNNYRGISLVSNLGKLFTSILNERLKKWSDNNDVITDAQFGFKNGYSTQDAIFALNSIISKTLSKKK